MHSDLSGQRWYQNRVLIIAMIVIALGAFLRGYKLNWDGPHQFHSDERNVCSSIDKIYFRSFSDYNLNPGFFVYGAFPVYLAKMVQTAGGFFKIKIPTDVSARLVAWFFSVLTLPLVFLLAASFYGSTVALLALIFLSFNTFTIQSAHFGTVESTLIFFLVTTVYMSKRLLDHGRFKDYLLAGIFCGLGMATKFSAITFIIPILIAHLVLVYRSGIRQSKTRWIHLLIAFAASLFTSFLGSPHVYLKPMDFLYAMRWEGGIVKGEIIANYVYQFTGTMPYLFQLKNLFLWHAGPPLGLFMLLGMAYVIYRILRRNTWLDHLVLIIGLAGFTIYNFGMTPYYATDYFALFVSAIAFFYLLYRFIRHGTYEEMTLYAWAFVYFLIIGGWRVKFMRYMLPLMPFFCIAAAKVLYDLINFIALKPYGKPVFRAITGIVIACTVTYAFSYLNVYQDGNTRVQAQKWLEKDGGSGKYALIEYWDDTVPLPDGWQSYILKLFENESIYKMQEFASELSKADYIILSSKRVYNSIFILKESYPDTTRYYRLLFTGRLGYELVKTITAYPTIPILNIPIIDETAEGSFQWFDHPKIQIFKNTKRYDYQAILRILTDKTAALPPITLEDLRGVDLNRGLKTPLDVQRARRGLPTEPKPQVKSKVPLAPPRHWQPIFLAEHPVFYWWLVVQVISIFTFPIGFIVFKNLHDRGWIFNKILGLALVTWIVWILVSLKFIEYDRSAVFFSLSLTALLGLYCYYKRNAEIHRFIIARYRLILFTEGFFLILYIGFLIIRAYNPDLYWSEKPMDLSFINVILRSRTFPPMDPWFAGHVVNYYYYGHMIVAQLIKITQIPVHIAFNLMMGLIPALVITGAFSLVYNLSQSKFFGVLGGLFCGVFGNFDGVWQLLKKGKLWPYDWWHGAHETIPNTINEFPYWSFLFSDLHAHVIVMPFFFLLLGMELNIFMSDAQGLAALGSKKERWLVLVLLVICFGLFFPTNAWDFATHSFILFMAFFSKRFMQNGELRRTYRWFSDAWHYVTRSAWHSISGWIRRRKLRRERIYLPEQLEVYGDFIYLRQDWQSLAVQIEDAYQKKPLLQKPGRISLDRDISKGAQGFFVDVLLPLILLIPLGFLFYQPFFANYSPIKYGPGWTEQYTTPLHLFLRIFGFMLFCVYSYIFIHYVWRLRTVGTGFVDIMKKIILWALFLVAFYLVGQWGFGWNWLTAVFLFPFMWLAFTSVGGSFGTREDRFALLMIAAGIFLPFIIEFVHLVDFMGHGPHRRMNTVFKIHLHGWLLLGTFSGYALWRFRRLFRELNLTKGVKWCILAPWLLVFSALTAGALIFPFFGTAAKLKLEKRFFLGDVPTLDGLSYLKNIHPKEYEAIRWLQDNIRGVHVILEATGEAHEYYDDHIRVAMNTGLPSLLGWNSHVSQWNHDGREIVERRSDIRKIYESENIQETLNLIRKYDIEYIYIGRLERGKYRNSGFEKFDKFKEFFELVYRNPKTRIYKVIQHQPAGYGKKEEVIPGASTLAIGGGGSKPGEFMAPADIALAASGQFYVADTLNQRIQSFHPNGAWAAMWGRPGDGEGQLKEPVGLAIDEQGFVYVCDRSNDRVIKFSSTGDYVSTFGEGRLLAPLDACILNDGSLLVSDSGNSRLALFSPQGRLLRYIGNLGSQPGEFREPGSLAIHKDGSILVHDIGNQRIQIFDDRLRYKGEFPVKTSYLLTRGIPYMDTDRKGYIYLSDPVANCIYVYTSSGDLKKEHHQDETFNDWVCPSGVAVNQRGDMIIVSSADGRLIRKQKPETVNMFDGGHGNKPGQFNEPRDLCIDQEGNIYIADFRNYRVQKFDSTGELIIAWGGKKGSDPGEFNDPCGIAAAPDGSIYVADTWNHRVQHFDPNGKFIEKWNPGFLAPRGITIDHNGFVYVCDSGNNRICKFTADGKMVKAWGGSRGKGVDQFSEPIGICAVGNTLYICDSWNQRIQVYNTNGRYIRSIDLPTCWTGDAFREPYIDHHEGYLYITDPPNNRIARISTDGKDIRFANRALDPRKKELAYPMGIAIGKNGEILVSDTWNHRIVRIDTSQFR